MVTHSVHHHHHYHISPDTPGPPGLQGRQNRQGAQNRGTAQAAPRGYRQGQGQQRGNLNAVVAGPDFGPHGYTGGQMGYQSGPHRPGHGGPRPGFGQIDQGRRPGPRGGFGAYGRSSSGGYSFGGGYTGTPYAQSGFGGYGNALASGPGGNRAGSGANWRPRPVSARQAPAQPRGGPNYTGYGNTGGYGFGNYGAGPRGRS